MRRYVDFSTLVGETLTAVHDMLPGKERVTFETASGRMFRMYHEEDCCESVTLDDVTGNPEDLIGAPILKADVTSNSDNPPVSASGYTPDSFTWTFYTLATIKGYVTLRWFGESNGYYSESVDFVEVPA